jgi:cytochrome P450
MLTGEFTVRRAQEMRPAIQAIVDSCLDDLAASGRPADLVATLAMPVPALVLASLLGIPDRDLDLFRTKAIEIGHPGSSPETRGAAYRTQRHYLKDLVESAGPGPEPGMLTRLTERYRNAGAVNNAEVLGFANLLILAGHESSANMIALSAAALLRNRDQWDILANDPQGTRQAVEELFRYFSVSDVVTSRVATADVEVGGVTIHAGEGVIASNNAANHDPELFEDPNRLDLTRPTRRHIAFGYGAHQCLGQHITRLELELVFNSLTARFPNLRLAVPFEELEFTTDARLYGLYAMPVVW